MRRVQRQAPAGPRHNESGVGEKPGVGTVVVVEVRQQDIGHIGRINALLVQQHRDALSGHVHAEAGALPASRDHQRLNLVDVTHPAIHKQNLAIIPAQNKEEEVRFQPLIPVRHKVHLWPGNTLFAVLDGFNRISSHCRFTDRPPSTTSRAPVHQAESSVAKKSTGPAISSGRPMRPSGARCDQ